MDTTLNTIAQDAADIIELRGWTRGTWEDPDGRVGLTGALRAAASSLADFHIARVVFEVRGRSDAWEDAEGRTEEEVVDYLREHPVTDEDLAATFGPQWRPVVAVIRQAEALPQEKRSPEEPLMLMVALRHKCDPFDEEQWDFPYYDETPEDVALARDALSRTMMERLEEDLAGLATEPVRAVTGLVLEARVGEPGITRDLIDTLMAPWTSTMGDPREVAP